MIKKVIKWVFLGLGAFFVFTFVIAMCSVSEEVGDNTNSEDNQSVSTESNKNDDLVEWKVRESVDEMTDTKNVWKSLESENEVEFSFPYDGGSSLKLEVRYMKKNGTDVILTISKGQLLSSEVIGSNYITVRFDEDAPQKFQTSSPTDGSSDCLFLKDEQKFINRAKTAKSIKIQVPVFQEGSPLFTFKVDMPLTWEY